jgi:hypothetical protein
MLTIPPKLRQKWPVSPLRKSDGQVWEVYKTHPEKGYRIVNHNKYLKHTLPAILHHHEHWDGSGYPNGLKGESIPLIAKILDMDLTGDEPKVKLSLKEAKPDPFTYVPDKYGLNGEYLGTVTGLPPYGVFVALEQGVSALCPMPHWADFDLAVGDKVLIKIKRINTTDRKIKANLIRLIRKGSGSGDLFIG